MIENREFSEVRSLRIFDHGFPTARHRLAVEGTEIARATRLHDEHPDQALVELFARCMRPEKPRPLLSIRLDIPLEILLLAGCDRAFWIRGGRRLAGRRHHHG